MKFLDLTLPALAENLALDEALLLASEEGTGTEVLRVWEWPEHAVVLGAGCVLPQEVDSAACQADSVPILRRSSGGGTVLIGPGCMQYSLVLSFDRAAALRQIGSSYNYLLNRVREALAVPDLELAGTSDLAIGCA